jgi:arginyl-tRNA--protein-N-Asp/Glu arginylyltransferase
VFSPLACNFFFSFFFGRFEVFLKYQTTIHNESEDKWKTSDFKRFLCSGLRRNVPKEGPGGKLLGSWHQCYRLDGRLIAVSVIDLLPNGVSAVYILYVRPWSISIVIPVCSGIDIA